MEKVEFPFLIISAGIALYCLAVVWSRKETVVRTISLVAMLLWMPVLAVLASETLGWHKPVGLSWRLSGEQRVLASKMVLGEAIYLYLDVGPGEPRAIKLPWSYEFAQQLQDAMRESRKNGQEGAMMKFDHSWDQNPPQFHAIPQPQLPMPKGEAPEAAPRHDRCA